MKIALPSKGNQVDGHFGHCEHFTVFTVDDSNNIAPAGWHVPSDDEWQIILNYLGGEYAAVGGKMKAAGTIEGGDGLWYYPNTGAAHSSGFSALPSGFRNSWDGGFGYMDYHAYFWPSTERNSVFAFFYTMSFNDSELIRNDMGNLIRGFSVRCVRD